MLNKKMILLCLIGLALLLPASGETFQFKYQKGIKYKMVTTVEGQFYVNGEFITEYESLDKISVEITDVNKDSGYISGTFQTSEKASQTDNMYKANDEIHTAEYWCDALGQYSSSKQQMFPSVTDVPLFPEKSIEIGDYWEAQGYEMIDLQEFGISQPRKVPLTVTYIYVKNETLAGVKCAVFQIYYSYVLSLGENPGVNGDYPYRIANHTTQRYFFDIANGRPYYYEDSFDSIYIFNSGDIYEMRGKSKGQVTEGEDLNKEEMVEEIKKIIADEGIADTAVSQEKDGVKITLEDINFPPDSYILVETEKEKLRKLAKILARYPQKDLLVSGHTALAGTVSGRQLLSEQRAQAVGEYLLSLGVSSQEKMVFEGFGADKPVADNSTAAGMKKNRRVEIKILEN